MNNEKANKEKNNIIKKIISIPRKFLNILKIVLFVIIIVGMYYLGNKGTDLFKSKATIINRQFENRSQLITQVERVTVVEDTKKDRTIFEKIHVPFTESRLIFSYDVIIEAGVDLSKIKYKSEDEKEKVLIINVPHAEMFNASIDYDSKEVYLDQDNLFSRIDFNNVDSAVQELIGKAKEKSKERGELLEKADENAKRLINEIIKSNDRYNDYKIEYEYIGD